MTPRPPPEHVEALRCAVETILSDPRHSVWRPAAFARKLARAVVWALYAGQPPLEAMARATYGADWNDRRRNQGEAAFQAWLRLDGHGFVAYIEQIGRLNLSIPGAASQRRAA